MTLLLNIFQALCSHHESEWGLSLIDRRIGDPHRAPRTKTGGWRIPDPLNQSHQNTLWCRKIWPLSISSIEGNWVHALELPGQDILKAPVISSTWCNIFDHLWTELWIVVEMLGAFVEKRYDEPRRVKLWLSFCKYSFIWASHKNLSGCH